MEREGCREFVAQPLEDILREIRRFEQSIEYISVSPKDMIFVWPAQQRRLEISLPSSEGKGKTLLPLTEEAAKDVARMMAEKLKVDMLRSYIESLYSPPAVVERNIYSFLNVMNAMRKELARESPTTVFQFVTTELYRGERFVIAAVSAEYRHISASDAIGRWVSTSGAKGVVADCVLRYDSLVLHIRQGAVDDTGVAITVLNGYTGKRAFSVLPSVLVSNEWIALNILTSRMYHSGYVEQRIESVMSGVSSDVLQEAAHLWRRARYQVITNKQAVRSIVGKKLGKAFADSLSVHTVEDVVTVCVKEAKRKYGAFAAVVVGEILCACMAL